MSRITNISTYLPPCILSNQELASRFPQWSSQRIYEKTGIRNRRISAPDQTAGDLALKAAQRLFINCAIHPHEIDILLLVTQTPDQSLPSTSCRIHHQLGLSNSCGAFDLNQGCSGYIYGLSVADGMIASGIAKTVLLLTADTYSKLIDPTDQSVATLFGDGATATLIQHDNNQKVSNIGPTSLGTDGSGGKFLKCDFGGWRLPPSEQQPLQMDGPSVLSFTLSVIPKAFNDYLKSNTLSLDDYDFVVFHQANKFILDKLYAKVGASSKGIISMEETGNTVSSSIPFALSQLLGNSDVNNCRKVLLGGFGVGLSWGFTTVMI